MNLKKCIRKMMAVLLAAVLMCSLTACGPKPYSTGVVDGDTYTNEWAELTVSLPSGYKMLDASQIGGKTVQKFDVGCAFAAVSETGAMQMPVCYVLCFEGRADIDEIGEEFTKEFGGSNAIQNVKQGSTTIQFTVDKNYCTIAGEDYMCFHIGVAVADVYCAFRGIEETGVVCVCAVTQNGTTDRDKVFDLFTGM
jgi:hypothetical protein